MGRFLGLPIKKFKSLRKEYLPFLAPTKFDRCSKCDEIKEGKLSINGKFICLRCELRDNLSAY